MDIEHAKLEELKKSKYSYSDLSQEIEATLEYANKNVVNDIFGDAEEITGVVTKVGEAEYLEIWATDDNRPFDLTARYYKIL